VKLKFWPWKGRSRKAETNQEEFVVQKGEQGEKKVAVEKGCGWSGP